MISYDIRTGVKKIKTKTFLAFSGATLGFAGIVMAVAMPLGAKALPTQVIVAPSNQQGWSSTAPIADTRTGGTVSFNNDTTAPGNPHNGALLMTTDLTTTAKAQYFHNTATPLSSVTELSYSTKQNTPIGPVADASYQLAICATGATTSGCNPQFAQTTGSSFTTLVYEPYQGGQGAVVNNVWQNWNISSGGLFWTTHTVVCSEGTLVSTPGGPSSYTLAAVQAACPDAFVFQFGLNIGSNNPGYNVEADLFNFNGTTYNFEPFVVATDKDQCKSNGWTTLTDANGKSFKNQGDCVSYVATHGKNQANG